METDLLSAAQHTFICCKGEAQLHTSLLFYRWGTGDAGSRGSASRDSRLLSGKHQHIILLVVLLSSMAQRMAVLVCCSIPVGRTATSPQSLDGLPWTFARTFTVPRGWNGGHIFQQSLYGSTRHFVTFVAVPPGGHPSDFGGPLTLSLAPPWGWHEVCVNGWIAIQFDSDDLWE